MTDLDEAEQKIIERLHTIEAAMRDISPVAFAHETGWTRVNDQMASMVHKNRVAILLLNLYHLKDDARGYARKKGLEKTIVEDFCKSSQPVDLCIKAGDTYKHGIGGRNGNSTVIEYEILIFNQITSKPMPDDPLVHAIKLIVDENGEPHQSDQLAKEALWHWVDFLEKKLGLKLHEWRKKMAEKPLLPGHSLYKGIIPDNLLKLIKKTAIARKKHQ